MIMPGTFFGIEIEVTCAICGEELQTSLHPAGEGKAKILVVPHFSCVLAIAMATENEGGKDENAGD